ncbi:MAG: rod shape-determining protein MreD [Draconibacterium sp.]|nr:rod shape-determining protein MreD [Draconibacterium sp.]
MVRQTIKYILMFVGLVLVQVLILNHVQFSGFVNPYIYVLFVCLLPLSSPRYVVLLLAFLLGITVDIFSNSLGVHSFATVFVAYLRPFVIRVISNREEDRSDYPGLKQNNWRWFLGYITIMVVIHHTVLFYLEVFTFSNFFETLYRVFLSAIFSIFVIVISQFIVFRE